jgi:cyanophycinase-like exopeptidase
VDDAYRWMIDRAGITPATGGRFVVIRTTGTDAYDPYLYYSDKKKSTTTPAVDGYVGGAFLGLSAAETLVLSNRAAADDDFVNTVVGTANAVWIAGGTRAPTSTCGRAPS